MPRNEGTIDRALRIILGLGLLAIVFVGPQTPWGWIGIVPLATGLVGFLPALSPARDQYLRTQILRTGVAPAHFAGGGAFARLIRRMTQRAPRRPIVRARGHRARRPAGKGP